MIKDILIIPLKQVSIKRKNHYIVSLLYYIYRTGQKVKAVICVSIQI